MESPDLAEETLLKALSIVREQKSKALQLSEDTHYWKRRYEQERAARQQAQEQVASLQQAADKCVSGWTHHSPGTLPHGVPRLPNVARRNGASGTTPAASFSSQGQMAGLDLDALQRSASSLTMSSLLSMLVAVSATQREHASQGTPAPEGPSCGDSPTDDVTATQMGSTSSSSRPALSRARASASQPELAPQTHGLTSVAGMNTPRLMQLQAEGLTRSGGLPHSDSQADLLYDTHVSLVDNDGASGVGLAAAAAVSAAAARAWASAASKQQRSRKAEEKGSTNSLASARGHSKAGFKLVASVYREPPITRAAQARTSTPSPSQNIALTTQPSSSALGGKQGGSSVGQASSTHLRELLTVRGGSPSPPPSSAPSPSPSSSSLHADAGSDYHYGRSSHSGLGTSPHATGTQQAPAEQQGLAPYNGHNLPDVPGSSESGTANTSLAALSDMQNGSLELGLVAMQAGSTAPRTDLVAAGRGSSTCVSQPQASQPQPSKAAPGVMPNDDEVLAQQVHTRSSPPTDHVASPVTAPGTAATGAPAAAAAGGTAMASQPLPITSPSAKAVASELQGEGGSDKTYGWESPRARAAMAGREGTVSPFAAAVARGLRVGGHDGHDSTQLPHSSGSPRRDTLLEVLAAANESASGQLRSASNLYAVRAPTVVPGCHMAADGAVAAAVAHNVPAAVTGTGAGLGVSRTNSVNDISRVTGMVGRTATYPLYSPGGTGGGSNHGEPATSFLSPLARASGATGVPASLGKPAALATSPQASSELPLPADAQVQRQLDHRSVSMAPACPLPSPSSRSLEGLPSSSLALHDWPPADAGPPLPGAAEACAAAQRGASLGSAGDPSCTTCDAVATKSTTLTLEWLSRPQTVLVVCKLSPNVYPMLNHVLRWLRDHGLEAFVEPAAFSHVEPALKGTPSTTGKRLSDSHFGHNLAAASRNEDTSVLHDPRAAPPGATSSGSSGGASGSSGGAAASGGGQASGACLMCPDGSQALAVPGWEAGEDGRQVLSCSTSRQNLTLGAGGGEGGEGGDEEQWGVLTWAEARCGNHSIPDEVVRVLDFVVVLGGDGTLLWTCHVFGNRAVPPLLPFALGSLGFLTPFPPAEVDAKLEAVLDGGFPMILRHRLHCTIVRGTGGARGGAVHGVDAEWEDGHCATEKVVLNEVVIDRGISPFLTNLETYCDGTFVTRVQGDGLIVSTPTGSTAYNLAAGGSMVHPQVPGILFTPVCPHSLSFRPLVFPDHVQLCIQVPHDARSQMFASFDGKDRQELNAGDAVIVRMSQWPIPTVCSRDPSRDWFMGIREGLHWNTRRVQAGAGQ